MTKPLPTKRGLRPAVNLETADRRTYYMKYLRKLNVKNEILELNLLMYNYIFSFQHITFAQTLNLCKQVIAENHGHLILKAILKDLKDSMGPTFVKTKWEESGLELKQWMNEDQVSVHLPIIIA